jgi:hypothetical protein
VFLVLERNILTVLLQLHYFIIELPSNVDINPYLGTHRYDAFLKGIQTSPNDVACLYEYNYKSFGDPSKSEYFL